MNITKSLFKFAIALAVAFAFVGCESEEEKAQKELKQATEKYAKIDQEKNAKSQKVREFYNEVSQIRSLISSIKSNLTLKDFNYRTNNKTKLPFQELEATPDNPNTLFENVMADSAAPIKAGEKWKLLEKDTYQFCLTKEKCAIFVRKISDKNSGTDFDLECKNDNDELCKYALGYPGYFLNPQGQEFRDYVLK